MEFDLGWNWGTTISFDILESWPETTHAISTRTLLTHNLNWLINAISAHTHKLHDRYAITDDQAIRQCLWLDGTTRACFQRWRLPCFWWRDWSTDTRHMHTPTHTHTPRNTHQKVPRSSVGLPQGFQGFHRWPEVCPVELKGVRTAEAGLQCRFRG